MKIKIVNINILFILDLKKKKMNYSQRVQKNQGRKIAIEKKRKKNNHIGGFKPT